MRTILPIFVVTAIAVGWQVDAYGQCQRGGGGQSGQVATSNFRTTGISLSSLSRGSVDPYLEMERIAMQQALMQQQLAIQQMQLSMQRMQMARVVMVQQQRYDRYARSRETARQRRADKVARREARRIANFAKRARAESQETLVVQHAE